MSVAEETLSRAEGKTLEESAPDTNQLTPFYLNAERSLSREEKRVFMDQTPRLFEKHPCLAFWNLSAVDNGGGPASGGLHFLPDEEALAELRGDMEPLIGSFTIWEMHYNMTTGRVRKRLITSG